MRVPLVVPEGSVVQVVDMVLIPSSRTKWPCIEWKFIMEGWAGALDTSAVVISLGFVGKHASHNQVTAYIVPGFLPFARFF